MSHEYDAVVVGAGPNGLAAALTLAQAGGSVALFEANAEIGGACRSAQLTLPGMVHDVCSAIHPLALGSPFFQSLALEQEGLKWIHPPFPLAHPLPDSQGVTLHRPFAAQIAELKEDGQNYLHLLEPFAAHWEEMAPDLLQPMLHFPRKPWLLFNFGRLALRSASRLATARFKTDAARALFAGLAAHSFLPLETAGSAAVGLVLAALAHAVGWPMPEGGSGRITQALGSRFQKLGGRVIVGHRVKSLHELPSSRVVLLDLTPRQIIALAGQRLPVSYREALQKYRYGPAVFKVDYALSSPIPWQYAKCAHAGTIHIGGRFSEIEQSERAAFQGAVPERPFVLLAQPSLFDPTRASGGRHIAWAYCHVPHACEVDMTGAIERQIERFAPGFHDCILARRTRGPRMLEEDNANLVGGDINGGMADLRQLVARPVLSLNPYRTPLPGLYLCSASTPPGGGVHGMCGHNAALCCLRDHFGK